MDHSKYTYSKSYAFTWSSIWFVLLAATCIKLMMIYPKIDLWQILLILMSGINLIAVIIRYLLPALNTNIAIEVTDEYIVSENERIAFATVEDFVLYDSGVIAVMLNEANKRPASPLNWLGYWYRMLFYRSAVIIDTRHVKVKAPGLFNNLIDRLDNPKLSASL